MNSSDALAGSIRYYLWRMDLVHESSALGESLAASLTAARAYAQRSAELSGLLAVFVLALLGLPFVILMPALVLLSRHADSQPLLIVPVVLICATLLACAAVVVFRLQQRRVLAAHDGLWQNFAHQLREMDIGDEPRALSELLAGHPEQYLRLLLPQADSLSMPAGAELYAGLLASAICSLIDPWHDRLLRCSAAISAVCGLALYVDGASEAGGISGLPGG